METFIAFLVTFAVFGVAWIVFYAAYWKVANKIIRSRKSYRAPSHLSRPTNGKHRKG